MEDSHLPSPAGTQLLVNLTGARIIANKTSNEDPDVYLPNHEEIISHIAVDVGFSLLVHHVEVELSVICYSRGTDWRKSSESCLLHASIQEC